MGDSKSGLIVVNELARTMGDGARLPVVPISQSTRAHTRSILTAGRSSPQLTTETILVLEAS